MTRREISTEELTRFLLAGNEAAKLRMARKRLRERSGIALVSFAPVPWEFIDCLVKARLMSKSDTSDPKKLRAALSALWPDLFELLTKALRATNNNNDRYA